MLSNEDIMNMMTSIMDMMDNMNMHMFFTTKWKNYPVLFKDMKAKNGAGAFGIFVLLFAAGFLTRGLNFLEVYLEQKVWKNPLYTACMVEMNSASSHLESSSNEKVQSSCCGGGDDEPVKNMVLSRPTLGAVLFRDSVRLALCILPEIFSFALMLASMSYTLLYFFGVVLGLGIGRFTFDRIGERLKTRPTNNFLHC